MDGRPVERLSNDIIQALLERSLLRSDQCIGPNTPLVSSGLIDSFGLVEVLEVLERVTGLSIPAGRIGPEDLDTIESMIRAANQWGKKQ